ncbi:MAG: hypothetical protein IJL86_08255 [Bacteroidales bacterium]|nr:hypothetical protein [Bacteroidales bacterium]
MTRIKKPPSSRMRLLRLWCRPLPSRTPHRRRCISLQA